MTATSRSARFPRFQLADELRWLRDVSVWSAPAIKQHADSRDAFLIGGDGYISARLGLRDRVSTMERILAPHLSSYNFGENNNFFLDSVRPSRDFYPPITFAPTVQHIWRVRGTAIIITLERDDTFELVTVNAVHPKLHAILRFAHLKNITRRPIEDIGISFEASPDIPFPIAGYRSRLVPHASNAILETLEELRTVIRDSYPRQTKDFERNRYLIRGSVGGSVRGFADLFERTEILKPNDSIAALHYLAPGLEDTAESAIAAMRDIELAVDKRGIALLFQETYDWWMYERAEIAQFESSENVYAESVENNWILQKTVERATGGYVVIDDYSGSWLRDHNGSHKLLLDLGKHEDVKRSMDRYYGLDRTHNALLSVYPSDFEPASPLPTEPDWENVEQFIPGDVPNFRVSWYGWYFAHTGDLTAVRERFDYLKGAFMHQRLHENGYLANYCFDETYGIGPVGPMRRGLSCDNSFNALRAAQLLAQFAKLLGREDECELVEYRDRIQEAIEKTFWLEQKGYYAMRITPEGKLDSTPLSVGLLRPLWGGALSPENDHAIRSALYTYKHLYQKNGFLKLIPTHDQTVTMAIGYLLVAMKKIGHPETDRVTKDLLKWADASGTYGEYLDDSPRGPRQCYEHLAHRSRMWESGLNTDALLYALTGYEPNAYTHALSLHPWLPEGWKEWSFTNMRVGQTRFSLKLGRARQHVRYTLTGISGDPHTVSMTLGSAEASPLRIDSKLKEVSWKRNRFGMYTTSIELSMISGESSVIEFKQ